MFEGDAGIEDGHFDSTTFSFLPKGWDAEEFESPVDRLSCGQHHLIDLERREPINGGGHGLKTVKLVGTAILSRPCISFKIKHWPRPKFRPDPQAAQFQIKQANLAK